MNLIVITGSGAVGKMTKTTSSVSPVSRRENYEEKNN